MQRLDVEPDGAADSGPCECCGDMSRNVWGYVHSYGRPYASYVVHWTIGRVLDHGAHIDLIVGSWGDGTSASDRYAVSLAYRLFDTGPELMVIDARDREIAKSELVCRGLDRSEVIGEPTIAQEVFAICDAILVEDARLAELQGM